MNVVMRFFFLLTCALAFVGCVLNVLVIIFAPVASEDFSWMGFLGFLSYAAVVAYLDSLDQRAKKQAETQEKTLELFQNLYNQKVAASERKAS